MKYPLQRCIVNRIKLVFITLAWLVTDVRLLAMQATAIERPSIVFLLTDDQRNGTLGCAGHSILQTPNIEKLATEDMRFENMFVSSSICWVSRATILTWRYARSWGSSTRPDVVQDGKAHQIYPLLLRAARYRTGFFGKWHAKIPSGFDRREHFDAYEDNFQNPYFKRQAVGSRRHTTQIIGDRAVEFIK